MDKAIEVRRGKESLVSARDIQKEFRGATPWGISFLCPLCRQPLFPAAMGAQGKQSPHFRHERNNERAQECENYVSNYGYPSTYQRAPLPLFIRQSKAVASTFIVEAGFRKLSEETLEQLEKESAKLRIGEKTYDISFQRFGDGFVKYPIESPRLNVGSAISLDNTKASLVSLWGCPEDARRAMVFDCDPIAMCGKRLKMGDTIAYGTDLILVAPSKEEQAIKAAFVGAKRIGLAGTAAVSARLQVYKVRLGESAPEAAEGTEYLETCGFEVANANNEAELIWPPSVMGDGVACSLFKNSKLLFITNSASSPENRLYVHSEANGQGEPRTVPLRPTFNPSVLCAILRPNQTFSFVTTRDWAHSALMLQPLEHEDLVTSKLVASENRFEVIDNDAEVSIKAFTPCEVHLFRRDKNEVAIPVNADNDGQLLIAACEFELLRIVFPLCESTDGIIAYEKIVERISAQQDSMSQSLFIAARQAFASRDYRRASARIVGLKLAGGYPSDKNRATARKALK